MRELSRNTNPNSTESSASLVEAQSCFAEALAIAKTTASNFLEVEKSDEHGSSQEFFECLAPRRTINPVTARSFRLARKELMNRKIIVVQTGMFLVRFASVLETSARCSQNLRYSFLGRSQHSCPTIPLLIQRLRSRCPTRQFSGDLPLTKTESFARISECRRKGKSIARQCEGEARKWSGCSCQFGVATR